ncbi:metallophosphoesterase [Bacillus marasmi]|uniref:metallophosphoesterase n=1 Tax=Bacillus marasmi TaxID=1926279 RepID=UPI0011CBF29C|nr:metallophosphoesterase [Bacillus marasmi]
MQKKVSRRSFLKKLFGTTVIAVGASSGIYYYAREIETRMLKVTEQTILHHLIPSGFEGCRIIQFSDTHLGFNYDLNQFERLITKINSLSPDIILFTGDLMDEPNRYGETEKIPALLKKLKAPLGKFCIYGNHDHGGYGSEIYHSIMSQSDFIVLQNKAVPIQLLDGSRIDFIGIDDAMLGKPNFEAAMTNVRSDGFKILLSHAPDLADQAVQYGIHWQISGHSHGGQIKVPFMGALVTPPFAEKYTEGIYQLKNQGHQLSLYVNRGIGTTRLPFRFLSQPELTIFTLARNA